MMSYSNEELSNEQLAQKLERLGRYTPGSQIELEHKAARRLREQKERDLSEWRQVIGHLLELPNEVLEKLGFRTLVNYRYVARGYALGNEVQTNNKYFDHNPWETMDEPRFDSPDLKYRIKPQTHTINGFEVPLPLQEGLKEGERYFVEAIEEKPLSVSCIWESDSEDYLFIERGIAHKERRNAVACAKARLGIDPYAEGK